MVSPRTPTPQRRARIGRERPAVRLSGPGAERIAEIAGAVPDPELPMISLANLGVLRAVDVADDGHITVTITPTYSGCPALQMMSDDVETVLADAGYGDVTVRRVLAHAWSTDDMTEEGHTALHDAGIAPPTHRAGETASSIVPCPHCGSQRTEELNHFGSTSCKALYRCLSCREPFDYFKVL